jgi:amino acid transporter/mannitol/fructose-specific phosphotransferase system IIA component (Ntr-type)
VKKALRIQDIFSIATGAMIGSGFFLLPGIAYAAAGPAVVAAYLLAALLMVPTLLSKAELATAMPRAGGTYFFVSRSMGPMAGVIDGLSAWMAMLGKTAFALLGMGFYLVLAGAGEFSADGDLTVKAIAVGTAVLLAVVNALGAKESGFLQTVLVAGLLVLSACFIVGGAPRVQSARFVPFAPHGGSALLATTGLVFVCYAGLTKVASVAEEIATPERTIPRGMFLSLAVATAVYVLGVTVVVGVVPGAELAEDRAPLATAANFLAGRAGRWAMVVAGCLAFVTTANAGILSASRYLYAMGRDRALPESLARLGRRETPVLGIAVSTTVVIGVLLFLDAEGIAKLASSLMLADFALVNLCVIVMRESGVRSYDPGYRSPFYPWMQLAGVGVSVVLIPAMGWMPMVFALGLSAAGLVWYAAYARGRAEHAVAFMKVLERIAEQILSRESAGPVLDRELREILKEKGLRADDPFLDVVARARVIDLQGDAEWDVLMEEVVSHFTAKYPRKAQEIRQGLYEASRKGDTPAAEGVALPHILLPDVQRYELLIARARSPLHFPGVTPGVNAVFALLGSRDDPQQHLRMLAALARRVEDPDFLVRWEKARDGEHLRRVLLGLPGH